MEKSVKECLILGNGKSVLDVPNAMLKTHPSFGVNYCFHQPNFYVCVDHNILINHWDKIYHFARGADFVFLAAKERGTSRLYELPQVCLVRNDTRAFKDERYFSGMTVTYVALKMAYYMGFETVHLWGVDHSKDWDHYRSDYPAGDVARRESLMAEMEYSYALAAKVYNHAGRRIINHSHPSNLDAIFER
jgi:hypothetical protein